jgi:two-component system cell cycle sensor histidine kinase/response regulator CckA
MEMGATSATTPPSTFSGSYVAKPKALNLNAVIEDLGDRLRQALGEGVELSFALEADLGSVFVDPLHIEQVLMSLVINAREAMPHGGRVSIETANVDLAGDEPHSNRVRTRYVVLTVSDSGCGIDIETRHRIFEPQFTTKASGKGPGLGLFTCRAILHESGGFMRVYSEPGEGSSFKASFPRIDRQPNTAAPASDRGPVVEGGSETILVIEDNDGIRVLARRILERFGYHILEASSGEEALEACASHNGTVHLLLCDVLIPGLGGPEIARRIQSRSGPTKTLFMSGYSSYMLLQRGMLGSDADFIQKPFVPGTLARRVREVLDA